MTTQTKPARRPVRPGQAASQVGGLAAALREWRGRRRVSQLELALRAGTTQRHVSFIESGRSVPGRAMVVRLAEGMAPRIINLDEWAWHVIDRLRQEVLNIPNGRLDALVNELEALVPDRPRQPGPDYLGFAVPLRLRSGDGELRLLTTLTHFGTAVDVTIAELRLEAFLPADEETTAILKAMARATTLRM